MATPVIDLLLRASGISNQDGTHSAIVHGGTEVPGPGTSSLGARPTAIRFGSGVSCRLQISPGELDSTRFAVRVLFRVTSPVTTRGNLVECTALPFTIFVQPGAAADRFNIEAMVANGATGWTGTTTANRRVLLLNQWYVASLIYDLDTLALIVDNTVLAVSAFPLGGLQAPTGDQLHVGTWVDDIRWPFVGDIAGVQVWRDIPADLEAKLDAERGNAEWHLSRKENEVRGTLNLGPKTADFYYDPVTSSYLQPYSLAVISFTEAYGTAFVMYGSIVAKWRSDQNLRSSLGALASDELPGRQSGSRKSVFARGCIYWSWPTGAVPVLGRIYLDFELIGEGSHPIGLPVADVETIPGGQVQRFQNGKMFLRTGASNAFEVHGSILAKYVATGGPGRFGFPTTHECNVLRGQTVIGKVSEFERCTIYWSPSTPAAVIYGSIRDSYRGSPNVVGVGGPTGDLGFPTSDEGDIPGAAGARYNTFQGGSILWFNGKVVVCRPFTIFLGRLDTIEEDRDFFDADGQNDLYCRISVDVNGGRVFDRRYPENSTHYPSANIFDLNLSIPYTINPNHPGLSACVRVEVWEADANQLFAGGDDNLGTMTSVLNMANAWGMRSNNGLYRSSNFGPWVNFLDWAIRPVVSTSTPLDTWGVRNQSTSVIDKNEYAVAFSDFDPESEFSFGFLDDKLKNLFYDLVVKGLAANGNCFGMALENIYAWKGQSRLGRPLSRFETWSEVENDFNVKHIYQVGADAVWWFVHQFLNGHTHDPMSVFQASWDAFNRGDNPVICLAQNYDFSGEPHTILPIGWNRNVSPWQMTVFDSNFPNQRRTLTIDPAANRFRYDGASLYTGDAWSGGRFHYMPWSVLNHRQRTPVWDAVLLLLNGIVMIFADSSEVVALTDENGKNLDASSARSKDELKGKLLRVPGLSGGGSILGSFYIGVQEPTPFFFNPNVVAAINQLQSTPQANEPAPPFQAGTIRNYLREAPPVRLPVANDALPNSIPGSNLMELERANGLAFLRPQQVAPLDSVRCRLRGKSTGKLRNYYKRALLGVEVNGDLVAGEEVSISYERMSGRENKVSITTDRQRQYAITMSYKLGAGKDFMKVIIEGLVVEAGQPLSLNFQPGNRVINLSSRNKPTSIQVLLEGVVNGKKTNSVFNTQLQGGHRLVFPDLIDPGKLKIEEIDQLQGPGRNARIINRQ
jgi:hypothetical protein